MFYNIVLKLSNFIAPVSSDEWLLIYKESHNAYLKSSLERSIIYFTLCFIIGVITSPFFGLAFLAAFTFVRFRLKIAVDKVEALVTGGDFDPQETEKLVIEKAAEIGLVTAAAIITISTFGHVGHASEFVVCAIFAIILRNQSASPSILVAGLIWPVFALLWYAFYHLMALHEPSVFAGTMFFATVGILLSMSIMRDRAVGFRNVAIVSKSAARTEEILKQMQRTQQMRETLERVAGIGFFDWNYETNKIAWSEGAYRAFGVDDLSYKPCAEDFFPRVLREDVGSLLDKMRSAKNTNEVIDAEFRIRRMDGEINHLSCFGSPILNSAGKLIGMEGLVIDQTSSKSALAKETEIKKLLNTALESSNSFVTLRYMSQNKFKFFGSRSVYGEGADVDLNNYDEGVRCFYTDEDYKKIYAATSAAEKTKRPQSLEHIVKRSDGTQIHARSFVYVIGNEETNDLKIVVMTTDITQSVQHRIELADALEKAQLSNKVKSEFLANMSHEIRTPLNGVIAVAGILARTELDERQEEMVKIIETSGQNLGHILNDVLDLARVESGKIDIERISFSLKETVLAATSLFAVKADEKGIDFGVQIDDLADNNFIGDPVRIRQIISNFLSNAIKFTTIGSVNLKVTLENISNDKNRYNCKIAVKDTGNGISEEALGRMFGRFEQADGSITRTHGGTGLGLAISKALAELMGAKIKAESIVGEGSTFYLELPLEIIEQVKAIDHSDSTANIFDESVPNLSVLVVDDNYTNRRIVEMILTQLGVDLVMAENGLEAVEAFKTHNFDMIFMDLQMPVMDGLTATKLIREIEVEENRSLTPIIALSANAMSHHIDDALNAGACLHVAKPFTPQTLIEAVEMAMDVESICRGLPENKGQSAECTSPCFGRTCAVKGQIH